MYYNHNNNIYGRLTQLKLLYITGRVPDEATSEN